MSLKLLAKSQSFFELTPALAGGYGELNSKGFSQTASSLAKALVLH
ncbi:hypothetical protein NU08_2741 [Flavobacterium anhuiense]|uniref:Uncharacterized protein n=1 Tax=Flavobacterium anhuiense TaxID=459526 RepID=A0A444VX60_9FLAO|nr:hypothetical protein NU08_2741 [Flavobacterium anhuiense]